jgi:hypothetical protein
MSQRRCSGPAWRRGVVALALAGAAAFGIGTGRARAAGEPQREATPPAQGTTSGDVKSGRAEQRNVDSWKLYAGAIDTNLDNVVDNSKAMVRVIGLDVPASQAKALINTHVLSIQRSIAQVDQNVAQLKSRIMVSNKKNDFNDQLGSLKTSWQASKADFAKVRTMAMTSSFKSEARADLKNRIELFYKDVQKADSSFNDLIDKLGVEKVESIKPSEPARGTSPEQR